MVIYSENLTIKVHIFYILICVSNFVQIRCLIDDIVIDFDFFWKFCKQW